MHASFSFHHSNLQLAFTTQAWNFNLKFVPCKQTYEMHIQMHNTSSWACSPYVCAQNFNWSPSFVISPLCDIFTIFVHYISPFVHGPGDRGEHVNHILPWIAQRRGMSYKWGGCINTYLRNPICSTHSLACKTFSHPMAWWIYWQVNLRCLHSQCKCPLFVGDLLWNGGGH